MENPNDSGHKLFDLIPPIFKAIGAAISAAWFVWIAGKRFSATQEHRSAKDQRELASLYVGGVKSIQDATNDRIKTLETQVEELHKKLRDAIEENAKREKAYMDENYKLRLEVFELKTTIKAMEGRFES